MVPRINVKIVLNVVKAWNLVQINFYHLDQEKFSPYVCMPGFLPGIFSGGTKSLIILIFLLFSDQI